MKRFFLFLLMGGLIAMTACTRKLPLDPPVAGPEGTYSYAAFDSSGVAVVIGWFTLAQKDSSTYSGEWHFKQVHESIPIGPQVGVGELRGGMENDLLWLNLNPNMVDNNVFLNGTITDGAYAGRWGWSTFIGPTTGGRFEAVMN